MRLVPSIDLEGPEAVKRIRGARGTGLRLGDPKAIVAMLRDAGFTKVHIVDLMGAEEGRPTSWALNLAGYAYRLGLEVRLGGGIRSMDDARRVVEAGASEVVLGTLWARNPGEAGRIARLLGNVWAAIDEGDKGEVMVKGWTTGSGVRVEEALSLVEELGFQGVIYTFIPREGLMKGIPLDRVAMVRRLTGLKLAYAGGISGPRDLEVLEEAGVDEAIVGMALYTGSIPLEVAVRYA